MKWWKILLPAIALIVGGVSGVYFATRPDKTVIAVTYTKPVSLDDIDLNRLWKLVNIERATAKLAPLMLDVKLEQSAQAKCNDMVARNYWSHNTPDGKEPWMFFDHANVNYEKAAENLAYGQSTAAKTVEQWMSSPEHRTNILDRSFTEVGYAKCYSQQFIDGLPEVVIVQHFSLPK